MLKRLLGKTPIDVWVIKQVDTDLLHLCGRATLEAKPNRKAVLAALEGGHFSGPVRMAAGGVMLNARLFAALVPAEALQLLPDDQARWQGRDWSIAQVPQRCWTFQGRLTVQPNPAAGPHALVSIEDVTDIRQRVEGTTPRRPGEVVFRAENANEDDPLLAPKREASRGPRLGAGREWRRDGD
ncbi:hypothetical protein BDK63_000042 [Halomonas campaniensis]|uniref:Uncharacterized protein n=1 Tax=Halomonas campaniensis TaxID=213554 RepID=A0A7W5JZI6_9GAMM|nr:hypothetical protein [Halomonas campaniensis]MBB3329206.1 hypothetical protein [Halomonas campaniensis]